MTQKEDTRTKGRGRGGQQRTLYFLCIVSCGGVIYRFTSHTDRRPCTGGRRHSSFHGITRPRPKVSPPPSSRATCRLRIVWQRASSERRQSNSSSLQDKQKGGGGFHRAEGRRDGWTEGEWVVAVADAGHTALPSRLAPLATRGGDHDTWRGILGRIAFFHRFHATRAVDAAEEARRSLA